VHLHNLWLVCWWDLTALLTQIRSYRTCKFVDTFQKKYIYINIHINLLIIYAFISWFSFIGHENEYQDIWIHKRKIWALCLAVQQPLSSDLTTASTVWLNVLQYVRWKLRQVIHHTLSEHNAPRSAFLRHTSSFTCAAMRTRVLRIDPLCFQLYTVTKLIFMFILCYSIFSYTDAFWFCSVIGIVSSVSTQLTGWENVLWNQCVLYSVLGLHPFHAGT